MDQFDASILVSGFDTSQILSDGKHYSAFICGHCEKMVSLDSVVCEPCNHPYCRKCLETMATECFMKQTACACSVCQADLSGTSLQVGPIRVAAKPLREAQPLAYKVLSLVQVECFIHSQHCKWIGDYGEFLQHAISHSAAGGAQDDSTETSPNKTSLVNTQETAVSVQQANTSIATADTIAKESPKTDNRIASSLEDEVVEFETRGESDLKSKPLSPAQKTPPDRKDVDASTEALNRQSRRNSLGSFAVNDTQQRSNSAQKRLERKNSNGSADPSGDETSEVDWNKSIDSLEFWVDAEEIQDVEVYGDEQEEEPEEWQEDSNSVEHDQTVQKAEKFKKQANAKFNKGEFLVARKLYTKGIKAMAKTKPRSDEEFHLLSDMYSNRAVTYFREKQFHRCIEDCEEAINHEPTLDKSWIRKWRGLMALGEFEDAFTFLEKASRELPESKKIRTAYKSCSSEINVYHDAQELMEKSEVKKAKKLLDSSMEGCDNIALLTFSGRVDMTLGESESALEKLQKVLRFNPEYIDALEMRAYAYFLAGETAEGAQCLYDTYSRHKDSVEIKVALDRVQKTHAAYSAAQSAVKRGQHQEAIENFTTAIQESEPLPPLSRLFATLRTERAESYRKTTQFVCALKDCQEVVSVNREYAPAWVVRSEVLIALGKTEDAAKELAKARRSWGMNNPVIEEGCQRVDFELRVSKVNDDLVAFASELENGSSDKLPAPSERASGKRGSMRRKKLSKTMSMGFIDTSVTGSDGQSSSRRGPDNLRAKRSSSFSDDWDKPHENDETGDRRRRASRKNSLHASSRHMSSSSGPNDRRARRQMSAGNRLNTLSRKKMPEH